MQRSGTGTSTATGASQPFEVSQRAFEPRERPACLRPTRKLVDNLVRLPLDAKGSIDFLSAEPVLVGAIADDAEAVTRTIHQGLGAIGHLLSHSAPEIEDGTIGADCIESLGFLMAELGDLAAACMTLAAQCRRAGAASASASPPPDAAA